MTNESAKEFLRNWNTATDEGDARGLAAVRHLYDNDDWQAEMKDRYAAVEKKPVGRPPDPTSDRSFGKWLVEELDLTWNPAYCGRMVQAIEVSRHVPIVNVAQSPPIRRVIRDYGVDAANEVFALAQKSVDNAIAKGKYRGVPTPSSSLLSRAATKLKYTPIKEEDPTPSREQVIQSLMKVINESFDDLTRIDADSALIMGGDLVARAQDAVALVAQRAADAAQRAADDAEWERLDAEKAAAAPARPALTLVSVPAPRRTKTTLSDEDREWEHDSAVFPGRWESKDQWRAESAAWKASVAQALAPAPAAESPLESEVQTDAVANSPVVSTQVDTTLTPQTVMSYGDNNKPIAGRVPTTHLLTDLGNIYCTPSRLGMHRGEIEAGAFGHNEGDCQKCYKKIQKELAK
jgi:hypothetical protein